VAIMAGTVVGHGALQGRSQPGILGGCLRRAAWHGPCFETTGRSAAPDFRFARQVMLTRSWAAMCLPVRTSGFAPGDIMSESAPLDVDTRRLSSPPHHASSPPPPAAGASHRAAIATRNVLENL
jgi:hypothetical protein